MFNTTITTASQKHKKTTRRERSSSVVFVRMQKTAPAPFNRPDADLVLITHLSTRFLVSKLLITAASDYFRDTLSTAARRPLGEPTVIDNLPESDATIETVLRCIYPVPEPVICDLDDLCDAYDAAIKYRMPKPKLTLEQMLLAPRFMQEEPVRVYAIARKYGLDDVAEVAMERALCMPAVWPEYEEFSHISAREYHSLITLHRRRGIAAAACLDDPQLRAKARYCAICDDRKKRTGVDGPPNWWNKYVERCRPVLMESPTSSVVCSNAFLAQQVKPYDCEGCARCILHALLPDGVITMLKQLIDALPKTS